MLPLTSVSAPYPPPIKAKERRCSLSMPDDTLLGHKVGAAYGRWVDIETIVAIESVDVVNEVLFGVFFYEVGVEVDVDIAHRAT